MQSIQNHCSVERPYVWAKIGENETTKHVLQKTERLPHRNVQIHSHCLQTQWQSAWIRIKNQYQGPELQINETEMQYNTPAALFQQKLQKHQAWTSSRIE